MNTATKRFQCGMPMALLMVVAMTLALAVPLTACAQSGAQSGAPAGSSAGALAERAAKLLQQQSGQSAIQGALSEGDIATGLKEALANGTRSAITQLGRTDGYWQNPQFRIPLPKPLTKSESLLRGLGAGPKLDELHLSMNRAAESAVPVAADVFADAIKQMQLADVRSILGGSPDAATEYFRRTSSEALLVKFRPIVADITAKAGLAQQYKSAIAGAGPLAKTLNAPDLDGWVAQKALDGLFVRVAAEEKNIRENPAARTSEILKKVFSK